MGTIANITACPILDSRGTWTVEAAVTLKNGITARASVPQGKSTGAHEVVSLPADMAVKKIEKDIAKKLKGKNAAHQQAIDDIMIKLDGTETKRRLGGNAILGVSIACAKAAAEEKNIPLWQHIRTVSGLEVKNIKKGVMYPRLFVNVINGGQHAGNNLDFQEYLVIPKARSMRESVATAARIYHALGDYLAKTKGRHARNIGDEGGYAPEFRDNLEPFHIIKSIIADLKIKNVDFGLDAAATGIALTRDELTQAYHHMRKNYPFIYLEDPFGEEEFATFAELKKSKDMEGVMITGDDLTTTNVRRMERAHAEGSINAIIVKPNQIGSVSEALDAVRAARTYKWGVVVSHRSGETNDDFVADFAYGVGADGLKLGAPARGERIAKYNRLLEIEREIK